MIELPADDIEQACGEDGAAALESHLADCPACVASLRTYRRTRETAAAVARVALPEELEARLHAFPRAQLARE